MVSPQENELKKSLLAWAAHYPYVAYLDACGTHIDRYSDYEYIVAVAGEGAELVEDWKGLKETLAQDAAWWFGILSYDLKNDLEDKLETTDPAAVPFPRLAFFKAEVLIAKRKGADEPEVLLGPGGKPWEGHRLPRPKVKLQTDFASNFSREQYLDTIQRLRQHIKEGDCYEINLAQNYTADAEVEHPAALWRRLTQVSPTPFASYTRFRDTHILCASPERFLQFKQGRLITQPIKGTARRSRNRAEDRVLAQTLRASEKEKAENVMIVDLSRHDLHKSSTVGGVSVPHLFEIQSFAKVHHLVSTIQAETRPEIGPIDALANTFPPGSMTGAPKFRTCELIDKYEPAARGIYAGSIGFFDPDGNFDFNVVIRSLIYAHDRKKLSYHVGGAITWDSDPQSEYEETLVKATAIREVLSVGQEA